MRGDEIPFVLKIEKNKTRIRITFCIFISDANKTASGSKIRYSSLNSENCHHFAPPPPELQIKYKTINITRIFKRTLYIKLNKKEISRRLDQDEQRTATEKEIGLQRPARR